MKGPNWHSRKRAVPPPRRYTPVMRTSWFEREKEPLPKAVPRIVEHRRPEIPIQMLVRLFDGSRWGASFGGKMELVKLHFQEFGRVLGEAGARFVVKVFEAYQPGDDPWRMILRAFAKDLGLDAVEAVAFVDRG